MVLLFFWWSGLWVRLLLALVLAAISVGGVMLINNRIMPLSLPRKLARERRKDMRRRRIRGRSRTVAGGASGGEGGKSAEDGEE